MSKRYDVSVKVISQKGHCTAGHKVGDEWTLKMKTPKVYVWWLLSHFTQPLVC